MDAQHFADLLLAQHSDVAYSVPCSLLGPALDVFEKTLGPGFVTVSNEGEAVASAFGASLDGSRPVVFLQNSGLGNALNPLTSLVKAFDGAMTLVLGYRGQPGLPDEPQHRLMGTVSLSLLESIGFETVVLEAGTPAQDFVHALSASLARSRTVAVLVARGALECHDRRSTAAQVPAAPWQDECVVVRSEAIRQLAATVAPSTWLVGTTGKISRELESYAHRERNFYMVGSMGCAPSVAAGIARRCAPDDHVVVLDGDGAMVMRLEGVIGLSQVGSTVIDHVVLDNGLHESTGGQWATSQLVDLPGVARAAGYTEVYDFDHPEEVGELISREERAPGAYFYRLRVGTEPTTALGRPRTDPDGIWRNLQAEFARSLQVPELIR